MVANVRPKKMRSAYGVASAVTHSVLLEVLQMKYLTPALLSVFLFSGCLTSLEGKDRCLTTADCLGSHI